MKRLNYKNFIWYPITDEEYWVEEFPEEFPNCCTIVCEEDSERIYDIRTAFLGWGTMAKYGWWFMIIDKKLPNIKDC